MRKILDVKNVNKSKNRIIPAKLESKKQDKKTLAPRKVSGRDVSNERRGRAMSRLLIGASQEIIFNNNLLIYK